MKKSLLPLACLLLLPAAKGCGPLWGSETVFREETKTIDATKIDGIFMATRSGDIEVVGTREEKIELRIVRKAVAESRSQAETLLSNLRVHESKESSIWKLQAELPSSSAVEDASIDFYLRVPSRMTANLETQNGAATLQSVEGKVAVRTHNGAVRISGARDAVRVRSHNGATSLAGDPSSLEIVSHNGSVEVTLAGLRAFGKESSIESHNGEIALCVPSGFSAGLHALCGNGVLRVETPGRWEKNASREVRGALGTGGPKLRLESHNGGIRVWEKK